MHSNVKSNSIGSMTGSADGWMCLCLFGMAGVRLFEKLTPGDRRLDFCVYHGGA